jgi:uncharacterized secreted protein with C-terminal beta-propeller domain
MKRGVVGITVAVLAILVIVPAACAKGAHRGSPGAGLIPFSSCDDLIAYGDAQARAISGGFYPPTAVPPYPDPNTGYGVPVMGAGATAGKGGSFSTTNVQERGVDEPDSVKTDGSTIFVLRGGSLYAIDGRARRPALLGAVGIPGTSQQMLLSGHRILVLSVLERRIPASIIPPPPPDGPPPRYASSWEETHPWAGFSTVLSEVDVGDPAHLRLLRTQEIDGAYLGARQVGDQVRVVIRTLPAALSAPPSSLRSAVAGWLPYSRLTDLLTGQTTIGPALDSCAEISRPSKFSGLSMLSVLTIDLARGLPAVDTDGVMSNGMVVYASSKGLYVATQRSYRRATKHNPGKAATGLHMFDISRPDETTYQASGYVRGHVRDQFSLSEDQGLLRVVSSAITPGRVPHKVSLLSILRPDGQHLKLIGRVGDIGRTEDVRAVRMIGDAAYVVTFRQIDPLFTVDLSNPRDPELGGKLEIPGYSAYLHPISDRLLLGVGSEADSQGVIHGSQVSLFDVSSLRKPRLIAKQVVPRASTSVELTHHAFLYWRPTRQAIIPFKGFFGHESRRFAGALSFRIGNGEIERTGKVAQPKGRGNAVQRSLVIKGRLFTVSCRGVEVDGLKDLRQQGTMGFPDPGACSSLY